MLLQAIVASLLMTHLRVFPWVAVTFIVLVAFGITCLPAGMGFCSGDDSKESIVREIVTVLKDQKIPLTESKLKAMAHTIYRESMSHDVDYRLILAIIKVESNFKANATAKDGSRGLMQLQPSLARGIAKKKGEVFKGPKELHDPESNVKYGTYHVAKLMEEHENVNAALHVYNAGIKKAQKRLSKEEEPDTPFIRRVLSEYHKYTAILPEL
jgi:soluble lytic murein transglycosylase